MHASRLDWLFTFRSFYCLEAQVGLRESEQCMSWKGKPWAEQFLSMQ